MGLIGLVVVLIIVGVLLYLVETQIPMAPPIKVIIRVVVILVVVLWLLQLFVGDIPLPRMR
jgi:O-antigen ligase